MLPAKLLTVFSRLLFDLHAHIPVNNGSGLVHIVTDFNYTLNLSWQKLQENVNIIKIHTGLAYATKHHLPQPTGLTWHAIVQVTFRGVLHT